MTCKLILSVLTIFLILFVNSSEKYGKFELTVNKFYETKGPKHNDCTKMNMKIINSTTVYFELNVTKPTIITKGKILVQAQGKDFFRIQMKNPCQHIFLKNIFMKTFNMTKSCGAPMGEYKSIMDINNIARQYYGGSFVYGNLTFQTMLLGDNCNFACTAIEVTMSPTS